MDISLELIKAYEDGYKVGKKDGYTDGKKGAIQYGEWEECDWIEYDGHGECVHYPKEGLKCSNCGSAFKKEFLWKNNYCPNCGSEMRF